MTLPLKPRNVNIPSAATGSTTNAVAKPMLKIEPQENHLSLAQVREAVPKSLQCNVTQELVDTLNNLGNDPEEGKLIRDNFLSFSDILKSGSYKTQDYINAVIYVSYKICGRSNTEAYYLTFPDRHAKLLAKGASSKDISAYVSAFNRGELVQQMLNRAMIPSWLLNQDVYQEAVNTQLELMRNAKSERVRFMAADSLMSHLGKPETNQQTGVNININSYSGIDDLAAKIQELSLLQQKAIENGVSTKEIAAQVLIGKAKVEDAEVIEEAPAEEFTSTNETEVDSGADDSTAEIARRLFGHS